MNTGGVIDGISNEVYGSRFYEGAPLGKVCRLAGLSREGENEVDWK
jgi:hypothetical protein